MPNSSILAIDRTLFGATAPGQRGPGRDGNERVFRFPQSTSITGTSTSDCLVLYLGYSLCEGLPLCRDAVGIFYSSIRLDSFPLCIVSNSSKRSTNNRVASRFFARTSSRNRQIVRICDVNRFLRKLLWEFCREQIGYDQDAWHYKP